MPDQLAYPERAAELHDRYIRPPAPDAPDPPPQKPLVPWRCCRCGMLMLRVWLSPGTVLAITCPRCGEHQTRHAAEGG